MLMRVYVFTVLSLALLLPLGGCVETRVVRSSWDQFYNDPNWQRGGEPAEIENRNSHGYAIKLMEFEGEDRYEQANRLIHQIRRDTNSSGLNITEVDGKAVLSIGRYRDPADLEARYTLKYARGLEIDGQRLFAAATIVPLYAGGSFQQSAMYPGEFAGQAEIDPLDLKQFAGYYSLQVGYFDKSLGAGRREAAVARTKELREAGEDAYYYHGENWSLVCIGLYTDADFRSEENVMVYGDHIRQLQQRYPYNLGNGKVVTQDLDGKQVKMRSSLVRVR